VLEFCSRKQCFDPRDKLYAVLGMMPDLNKFLKPDYRHSVRDVYGQFARYMLEQRQLFVLLLNCSAGKIPLDDELPTWVPDLRTGFGYGSALQDVGSPLTKVDSEDSIALWEYVQPAISSDALVMSCSLCYYGTVQPSGVGRVCQVGWEPHIPIAGHSDLDGDIASADGAAQRTTISWEVDHAVKLDGDPTGCIVCSAHPDLDFFRPLLRADAENPGLWKIVGGWSRFQYQGPDYGPNERRLYHLS
jgi:hypothetical protein